MFRLLILSMNCLASLVLLTAIEAAQEGVDPSKGQYAAVEERELIQQFGDHSYDVREKATRALICPTTCESQSRTNSLTPHGETWKAYR